MGTSGAPKSPVDVSDVTVHAFGVYKLLVVFRAAVNECSVCLLGFWWGISVGIKGMPARRRFCVSFVCR